MAVVVQTSLLGATAATTIARVALTAVDMFTYVQGAGQILVLYNTTASLVTATIIGSGATTISPTGYGGTISVAAGKPIAVAANTTVLVPLDGMAGFLVGSTTITGGTGIVAHLYV